VKIAMIGQKGIPATYGGVERHVEELAARLAAMGHDVTAYCRRHYTADDVASHRGVALRTLRSLNTKHFDAISGTAAALADALFRGYDVIHFHAIGPALLSVVPRLLLRGCRVVTTVHSLDWRRRKWNALARWCLRRGENAATRFAHRTIVVSKQLEDYFAAKGKSVRHIPNGVVVPPVAPREALDFLGLGGRPFVLWMGRFVPEKRVEDLIRAFRKCPEAPALVLGGELDEVDPYIRRLREEAAGDERILFAGGLYGPARAAALHHAALFVLPSELEGFPITLLEAMGCGRIVLVSDLPEHLGVVEEGENGCVYPVGDVDALAARLAELLRLRDDLAPITERARQDMGRYDWDRIAEETAEVYERALAG